MSIDVLQDKIRKTKNPSMIDLSLPVAELPPHLIEACSGAAGAYGLFCRELLEKLKGTVPAVRIGFTAFAVLGPEGLSELTALLKLAKNMGYYVAVEAPFILSPMMAQSVADAFWGPEAEYLCDGLIINAYPGSDVINPFFLMWKRRRKICFRW